MDGPARSESPARCESPFGNGDEGRSGRSKPQGMRSKVIELEAQVKEHQRQLAAQLDAREELADMIRDAVEASEARMMGAIEDLGASVDARLREVNGRVDDLSQRLSITKGNLTAVTMQAKAINQSVLAVDERLTRVQGEMEGNSDEEDL